MKNNKTVKLVNIYYTGFIHRGGGAYIHVVNLSKGLKELGYRLNVFTLDSLPTVLKYLPHIAQKLGNLVNFPMGFLYKQKMIRYFYKLLFNKKSDINIFEDIYISWNSNVKSITILHALWSDNLQAFSLAEKKRIKLEKLESSIINHIVFDVVTVSKPYKEFLVSRLDKVGLKKRLGVVELGVNTNNFHPVQNFNKSIIFVGALEERKNIKFLLEVFQKLRNYKLTLVGDGPQRNELLDIISRLKIKNVTLLGRLTNAQVLKELPRHQYYMHTSSKESFSYSLLEAKLSGLTTIAFEGLEVPEEFVDIKVGSFNIQEWVDRIKAFNNKETSIDKIRFSYLTMTKNTLRKIK